MLLYNGNLSTIEENIVLSVHIFELFHHNDYAHQMHQDGDGPGHRIGHIYIEGCVEHLLFKEGL